MSNKIGIFFGSTTGDTERIANAIASKMKIEKSDIHNAGSFSASDLEKYDVLLLGSSTWGFGDLQDDWESGVSTVEKAALSGKKAAVFGCGDSASYPDSFCGALGKLAESLRKAGASIIGQVDAGEYSYSDSESVENGKFVGLALDEVNESDKTDARIDAWIEKLNNEL